jgi:hypothetical protein
MISNPGFDGRDIMFKSDRNKSAIRVNDKANPAERLQGRERPKALVSCNVFK